MSKVDKLIKLLNKKNDLLFKLRTQQITPKEYDSKESEIINKIERLRNEK